MKKFGVILIFVVIILVVIGGYFGVQSMIATKRSNEQVTQTISETMGSSTDITSVQSDSGYKLDLPNATTTTPGNWKNYTNAKLGFSLSYPSNLVKSVSGDTLTLTFPKEIYFHWPLQDDVVLRVTASSSCPDTIVPESQFTATTTFSSNGYSFTVTEGDDAGAGNRYQEIVYETHGNGLCYHMSLYNHGVNGAGFYVEGQALIQKYDNQHDIDVKAVIATLNSITNSFRLQAIDVVQ